MVTKVKVFWHIPSQAEYPWVWPSLVKIAQSTASREESWHWWEAQFSHTPAAAQPLHRFRADGWRWKLEMSKNVNIYNCCIFGCQLISRETAGRLWTVTQRDVWFQWFISLSHISYHPLLTGTRHHAWWREENPISNKKAWDPSLSSEAKSHPHFIR